MTHPTLLGWRHRLAITAGKAAGYAARLSGRGGGTSLPGLIAERIAPTIATTLAMQLPHGSVAVAGTNGKTTTSALLAAALESGSLHPVHNRAGANLSRGIASTLLARAGSDGRLLVPSSAIGLFECDEAALPSIIAAVRPRVVTVTNLFRDQLDRYGELDGIAQGWRRALATLPLSSTLVLNADDPLVATLGDDAPHRVVSYGFNLPPGPSLRPSENADSITCRRCGALLAYAAVYYGHLGRYHCPHCGWERPPLTVTGLAVERHGLDGTLLRVQVPGSDGQALTVPVALKLPGLYNAYNALATLATVYALALDPRSAAAALGGVTATFGRAERLRVGTHDLWLLLVKNPTGCDEVLRLLTEVAQPLDLLAVLNDRDADGHDISWIWDAAFEEVVPHLRHITVAGTRAEELALRLKYADYSVPETAVLHDPLTALDRALTALPPGAPLYVVATYTAILDLRRGLVERGVLRHYLESAS